MGAALPETGQTVQAETVYRAVCSVTVRMDGLYLDFIRASMLKGKAREAAEIKEDFQKAWAHADIALTSSRV